MICEHEIALADLRRSLARERVFSPKLGLTAGESRMLALLYKREYVRPEALRVTYMDTLEGSQDYTSMRVGISKMRRKLPAGVVIHVAKGFYELTGKEVLRDYIIRI